MKMNQKTMENINNSYKKLTSNRDEFKICVGSSLRGTSVFRGNWEICSLSDLSTMIEELQEFKKVVEEETGMEF